jgi:hypothetical protein
MFLQTSVNLELLFTALGLTASRASANLTSLWLENILESSSSSAFLLTCTLASSEAGLAVVGISSPVRAPAPSTRAQKLDNEDYRYIRHGPLPVLPAPHEFPELLLQAGVLRRGGLRLLLSLLAKIPLLLSVIPCSIRAHNAKLAGLGIKDRWPSCASRLSCHGSFSHTCRY